MTHTQQPREKLRKEWGDFYFGKDEAYKFPPTAEVTADWWLSKLDERLQEVRETRCTKCMAPFESHHHRHITRDGIYHTSCYNIITVRDSKN